MQTTQSAHKSLGKVAHLAATVLPTAHASPTAVRWSNKAGGVGLRAAKIAVTTLPTAATSVGSERGAKDDAGSEVLAEHYRKAGMTLNLRADVDVELHFAFNSRRPKKHHAHKAKRVLGEEAIFHPDMSGAAKQDADSDRLGPPCQWKLVGPKDKVERLWELANDAPTGDMAPVRHITVPPGNREPMGIPAAAEYFVRRAAARAHARAQLPSSALPAASASASAAASPAHAIGLAISPAACLSSLAAAELRVSHQLAGARAGASHCEPVRGPLGLLPHPRRAHLLRRGRPVHLGSTGHAHDGVAILAV